MGLWGPQWGYGVLKWGSVGFGGSQWCYVIPSGVMGSLKGLYGVMGTLNGALWGYGDPKWGSVGFGGP